MTIPVLKVVTQISKGTEVEFGNLSVGTVFKHCNVYYIKILGHYSHAVTLSTDAERRFTAWPYITQTTRVTPVNATLTIED